MVSPLHAGEDMTIEEARAIAAMCWCAGTTSSKIFDPVLAEEFAETLLRMGEAALFSTSVPAPECHNLREREIFKKMGLL